MTQKREVGATILCCVAFAVVLYRDFLWGPKLLLFKDIGSDSITIFLPMLSHFLDRVREGHLWGYSFQSGLGQEYLLHHTHGGIFALPLAVVGKLSLPAALAWYETAKLAAGGVFAALFVRERGAGPWLALGGGLLFIASGYFAFSASWPQLSVEGLCAAWMFYGAERLVRRREPLMFLLGCSAMSTLQPMWTWVCFVGVVVWILLGLVSDGAWRRIPHALFLLGASAGLGVALVGIFVLPQLHMMVHSPRGGDSSLVPQLMKLRWDTVSDDVQLATAWLRMLAVDAAGNGHAYRGWTNFLEGPLYACGSLVLVAIPAAWPAAGRAWRIRVVVFVVGVVVVTVFPALRRAYWLFTGDYYRHLNFTIALGAIALAIEGLQALLSTQKTGLRATAPVVIGASLAVATWMWPLFEVPAVIALLPEGLRDILLDHLIAAALTVVAAHLLRARPALAVTALLTFVSVDGVRSVGRSLDPRPTMTRDEDVVGVGYRDHTEKAVRTMRNRWKAPFRTAKNFSSGLVPRSTLNDGLIQDHWGIRSYASFNLDSTAQFFAGVGLADLRREHTTRWLRGMEQRPLVQGFVGARLMLARKRSGGLFKDGFIDRGKVADLRAYENPWALPLAVHFDAVVPSSLWKQRGQVQRDRALFAGAIVDDPHTFSAQGLSVASADAFPSTAEALQARVDELRRKAPTIKRFGGEGIDVVSHGNKTRLLFFSIPFDQGWHATIDGAPATLVKVSFGFTGVVVPEGSHRVALRYEVPRLREGAVLTGFTLLVLFAVRAFRRKTTIAPT